MICNIHKFLSASFLDVGLRYLVRHRIVTDTLMFLPSCVCEHLTHPGNEDVWDSLVTLPQRYCVIGQPQRYRLNSRLGHHRQTLFLGDCSLMQET